jgi:hypothetical protein
MITAIFWSALATVTLLIGMALAYRNLVGPRWTGLIMTFGAGAIINAAAYQLILGAVAEEIGTFARVGLGIAAGALTFYFADRWVDHLGGAERMDFEGGQAGGSEMGILLGSMLDGVPNPWYWAYRWSIRHKSPWHSSLQSQLAIFPRAWVERQVCSAAGGRNPRSLGYGWQSAV